MCGQLLQLSFQTHRRLWRAKHQLMNIFFQLLHQAIGYRTLAGHAQLCKSRIKIKLLHHKQQVVKYIFAGAVIKHIVKQEPALALRRQLYKSIMNIQKDVAAFERVMTEQQVDAYHAAVAQRCIWKCALKLS